MTHRVAVSAPVAGAHYVSRWPALGIPGAEIPTTGDSGASPLANDDINPASEYRLVIKTRPSAGTLTVYPDTSLLFECDTVGVYSFVYEGFEDGASIGEATSELRVGVVNATTTGGTGISTGIGTGGDATGSTVINGSATGGTGTSTGSGTGGDAVGDSVINGTVTGGTGTSTGSGTGGDATGVSAGEATVAGGTGTSTGSGYGGDATAVANATITGGTGVSTGSGRGGTAHGAGITTIRERISVKSPISRIANIASPVSKRIVVQSRTGVMA